MVNGRCLMVTTWEKNSMKTKVCMNSVTEPQLSSVQNNSIKSRLPPFLFFFFISPLASRRVVCKSNQKSFCMKINTTLKDTSLCRHLSLKIKSCFSGSPAVMALCVNSSSRTGPEQNSSENKSFHFDQVLFCVYVITLTHLIPAEHTFEDSCLMT